MVDDTYCTKNNFLQKQKDKKKGPRGAQKGQTEAYNVHQDDPANLAQQHQSSCHCSLNLLQFFNSRGLLLLNREVFDTHKVTNFADNLQSFYEIFSGVGS